MKGLYEVSDRDESTRILDQALLSIFTPPPPSSLPFTQAPSCPPVSVPSRLSLPEFVTLCEQSTSELFLPLIVTLHSRLPCGASFAMALDAYEFFIMKNAQIAREL